MKRVFCIVVGVGAAVAGSASASWASQPAGGGPQNVEITQLIDDPVSLQCGNRHVTFTGGQLVTRSRQLPTGIIRDVRIPVDAVAVDQFGMTYRLHGSASSAGSETAGSFRLTGVLIASNRSSETIHFFVTYAVNELTVRDTGTCSVVFAE